MTAHQSFKFISSHEIESLHVTLETYEHIKTGAKHYHIAAENKENVFLVALKTVPTDSTGVAHILEHTVLCGSERFPVRDPFFMMVRRSLNSFMNAFTSSDWTAYPFASQNRKDFNNLLEVYLDAVFFANLHPLDFAQEGYRIELKEPERGRDSDLVYKGVVFNEMKGAMSSPVSKLWQTISSHLYQKTTYHHNSGGEPANIPDLSYDELKSFYDKHYHPSNAYFMTFGDIPAEEHQEKFDRLALSRFERSSESIHVGTEDRFDAPRQFVDSYGSSDPNDQTSVIISWLLSESTDLEELLSAQFLSNLLLDNSASPLRKYLETTQLAETPSPLCGLEDSNQEMAFLCGLEGIDADKAEQFEEEVLALFERLSQEGVSLEQQEAVLHQLEVSQREIGGDGYPYGLQLILASLSAATHGVNPSDILDIDPVLSKLRERIQNPDYIKGLIRHFFLENNHRVRVTMKPSEQLLEDEKTAEVARLAEIKTTLSDDQIAELNNTAEALKERQEQEDDSSILPKVELSDIHSDIPRHDPEIDQDIALSRYHCGTNGISYHQAVFDMPKMTKDEWHWLPLYTSMITEVGFGEYDYADAQLVQSQTVGSLSAYSSIVVDDADAFTVKGYVHFSGKALNSKSGDFVSLLKKVIDTVRFDERERVWELLLQMKHRKHQSITGSGHSYAMLAASSAWSPLSSINHELGGLVGIHRLVEEVKDISALDRILPLLQSIHAKLTQSPVRLAAMADAQGMDDLCTAVAEKWQPYSNFNNGVTNEITKIEAAHKQQCWTSNTQVNFVSRAFPSVMHTDKDAAALTVLSSVLRNGYLHRAIREQGGAYGGGASQDNAAGVFRFYSYRDPRMLDTLDDFTKSVEWFLSKEHGFEPIEEAILGVVGSIDKPGSPAGEARQDFHNRLMGRSYDDRHEFRDRVLAVTEAQLKEVARKYLLDKEYSQAIVTNEENAKQLDASQWQLISV
jgi:Zn-dependent M16 (insulinase) family peptidase